MKKKEDPEKVALRVRRFREKHQLERIEIDVKLELKEEFKNLRGLENQKNADKLKALIDFWNGNFNIDSLPEIKENSPLKTINKELSKLLPDITQDEINAKKKEISLITVKVLERYKNSKPLDMKSHKDNLKYWRETLEKDSVKKSITKLEENISESIKEIITKGYIPMIESDVKELSKYPIALQLKIWKKSLEIYSYQEGKQFYIKEVELLLSKKAKSL